MSNPIIYYKRYVAYLNEVLQSINEDELQQFLNLITKAKRDKNTIFIIGNGGSASTASHWANDLGKGLYHRSNVSLKAMSLADNISWMTAVANDIGYELIFSDQLKTHGKRGDLLISISASGNSPNIIQAIEQAKKTGITTLSIIGFEGGKAKQVSDYYVHIRTQKGKYGPVEDVQLVLNHFLCDYLAGAII